MQLCSRRLQHQTALTGCGRPAAGRLAAAPRHQRRDGWRAASQSGRNEPFNEGAAQVQRLVSRDRKELLGNKIDILDKYTTEFGDPDDEQAAPAAAAAAAAVPAAAAAAAPAAAAAAAAPAAAAAAAPAAAPAQPAVQTKFTGGGSAASPFGAAPARPRASSLAEPKGLSPDMSPDPIVKVAPTPANFISRITITQVVLFFTFSSMIGLMLATFYVVVNTGAVRLAGID